MTEAAAVAAAGLAPAASMDAAFVLPPPERPIPARDRPNRVVPDGTRGSGLSRRSEPAPCHARRDGSGIISFSGSAGNRAVEDVRSSTPDVDARRAMVLHTQRLVVDLIELTLNHGLFVVRAAESLAEAEAILAAWRPHMTVIDMDHDDSTALLQRLGASNSLTRSPTPVLGLTRRGDLKTKLRAFDLGVDDILTVPFVPEELLARSVVITRRVLGTDRPIVPTIRLGEIEIDILNRQVRAGESIVHLSGIEQSLLYLLASRSGRVVTRDEILDAIWGPDFVAESNIVDRHVRSLRIKLQNDYRHPRFIATVPGKGYRFIPTFSNVGWDAQRDKGEHPSH
ncbi:MAG TPA: response regulator transcription factor [Candidatus Limnocylindrales bacterium]|nr:response regulator transcription factor [Candidatus Limnocylindrales bacterium]